MKTLEMMYIHIFYVHLNSWSFHPFRKISKNLIFATYVGYTPLPQNKNCEKIPTQIPCYFRIKRIPHQRSIF